MKLSRRKLLTSAATLAAGSVLPLNAFGGTSPAELTEVDEQELKDVINLYDIERVAKRKLSDMAFTFIESGAAEEITARWNLESWQKIKLQHKVLVDISKLDTKVNLFGQTLDYPIIIAPSAYHRLIHPQGELATAKGAEAASALYVVSSNTTTPIEDIRKASAKPFWFQLYIQDDREFTKSLVQKVIANGCTALCVSVDTPVTGMRDRQVKSKFKLPEGITAPYLYDRGMARQGNTPKVLKPLTWKDIEWLRSFSTVPVLLKGILNPLDADEAAKVGASGIIVSNHGGRNLDTLPPTAEVMPRIADKIQGRIPVLMDGGIRRGTDVIKALGMGANAVLVGRPVCYGLGAAGAEGVTKVMNILRKEFETSMILCGRPTIASIDRSVLF
jgi:4-hydroxymandelate oxidase